MSRLGYDIEDQDLPIYNRSAEDVAMPLSVQGAMSAAFELGGRETITQFIARKNALEAQMDEGPLLPPEELNEIYKGEPMRHPFDTPMTRRAAQFIVDQNREEMELGQRFAQARGVSKLGGYAAMFAASMTDPAEFAAGALTGYAAELGVAANAIRRTGGTMRKVSKMASEAASQRGLGKQVAFEFAEGSVGAALIEPLAADVTTEFMQDYTSSDFLFSTMMSGAAQAGLRFGITKLSQAFGFRDTATSQVLQGKQVDLDPQARVHFDQGNRFKEGIPDEPMPIRQGEASLDNIEWHGYAESASARVDEVGGFRFEGQDYGDGLYLTSRPAVANGHAARGPDNAVGSVHSFAVPQDARLLDLDSPLPDDIIAALRENIKRPEVLEADTAKGVFDNIKMLEKSGDLEAGTLRNINEAMKEVGLDGYRYRGGVADGFEGKPHDVVMLFDSNRAKSLESNTASKKLIHEPDENAQIAAYNAAQERNLMETPEERNHQVPEVTELKASEVRQRLEEGEASLRDNLEDPALREEAEAELAELEEIKRDIEAKEVAERTAMSCLLRGA